MVYAKQHALTYADFEHGDYRLTYGPVNASGPHHLAVTLDGAHISGSPFACRVYPAEASAAVCELHGDVRHEAGRAPRVAAAARVGERQMH